MKIRAFNLIPGLVYLDLDEDLSCVSTVDRDADTEKVLVTSYRDGVEDCNIYHYDELVNVQGVYVNSPASYEATICPSDMGREVGDRD